MEKLNNRKVGSKGEVTGKIIGGGDMVVDRIWRFCNMAFLNDVVLEDWRSATIVSLYK